MTEAHHAGTPVPFRPRWRGFFARPVTPEGRRSLHAILVFVAVMAVFFVEVIVIDLFRRWDVDPLTWTWMALMFTTLGVAALVAFAGLWLALAAVFLRGERSLLVVFPILLGVFVAFFVIGELGGHEQPQGRGR
jgi:hypothetical protein